MATNPNAFKTTYYAVTRYRIEKIFYIYFTKIGVLSMAMQGRNMPAATKMIIKIFKIIACLYKLLNIPSNTVAYFRWSKNWLAV